MTAPDPSPPMGVAVDDDLAGTIAARLDAAAQRRLGRSLAVFPVLAADCGGCALEVAALRAATAGLARFGLSIAQSPAEADILLVSGAATRTAVLPLQLAYAAMAEPRWVVAVGDCARDGGIFAASYAVAGGLGAAIPVDLLVPGCPPTPDALLAALRALIAANA